MKRDRGYIVILSILFCHLFSCQNLKNEEGVSPEVRVIFPSADTLPENLLRMYIHFSKPMKTIGNLEKIRLLDENDQELKGAIFNNVYELWDKSQKQLTIILDPARVKTGLKANSQLGRALLAGNRYKLVIGQLEDVAGNPLEKAFIKPFYVSKEDRVPPNTARWSLDIPKAESQSPLVIQFPEMLDRFSVLQRLQLTDKNNQPVAGQVDISERETVWQFTPEKAWSAVHYFVYVHTRLEDPSGNNLNGLFDHAPGSLKNEREGIIEKIPFNIIK